MKNIVDVIFLSVVVMSFKSNKDNTMLYQQSLLLHLSNIKADTIYILKCFDTELPSKIGKHTILDISENTSSFLNGKSSLYAIKLMPVEMNKGTVEIVLVDYVIRDNAGEVMMSNAGSIVYSYRYESKSSKYKLIKKSKNTM
ncbi:MAG TPA: hypothetical protein PKE07_00020 [Lacibacter sp.]|nr:hypothetical protein [Lacibacter sp.]HMO88318.1 hypothetical protein [Lacibacter sp.]